MSEAGRRRAWLGVCALVPLLVVAFHWRAARPGWAFSGSDLRFFFFGIREAVAAALRRGELPGWQRGILVGYPLLGDPQAAVFSPATWLTLPWDAPRALTLATLLHLSIAGWGMAVWMRLRGLSPEAGLLAAVLFALGAKETVHVIHWNFAATTAWWPWMLAGVEGFAATRRGRFALLAAAAAGLSWLGGSPQMALFGSLVAGLYALALAPGVFADRPADAALLLAAVPAGLLLAGISVLPVVELSRLGPRSGGVSYAFATSWKWPDAWGLALLVLPRAYGPGWGINFWEATGYLGVLPVALAAAAPLRRRGVALFLALGLLGVCLALGEGAPLRLHQLAWRLVPGYANFRAPTRSLFVTAFAAALLAAEGLDALRFRPERARALRVLAALAALAGAAALLPRLPGFPFDREASTRAAILAVILAAAGAAFTAATAAGFRGRLAGLAAVAIAFADSWVLFSGMNDVAQVSALGPGLSDFRPLVPDAPSPRRIGVLAKWGASANAPLRQGWEGALGYGPMCIERVREVLEGTLDDSVRPLAALDRDATFPAASATSPLWPLLGAPLVVSDRELPLPELLRGGREWERPLVAYRAPALPRVFWAGAWEVAVDARAASALLAAARGDRAVLAETPPLPPGGAPAGPVPAEGVVLGERSLLATVVAPRDGLAVVLEPFYPGWTARVDGRAAPILRADYAFEAVPVPAGRHELRLEYRDRLLPAGAALSLGALALLAAGLWRRRRRS